MRVARLLWRHVPAGAEALHLGWIQRARGRWNTQRPRFACLYTSYNEEGAIAEWIKHFRRRNFGAVPRDLVSIRATVSPVLNLTRPTEADTYGIGLTEMTGDQRAHLAACRRVARKAILVDGFRAILAPSASLAGEKNLMIYPESHHGRLLLSNGPDRLALNYGPHPRVS